MPAAAPAGSLLSGYGGPGQGSQVILGGSLVNGPRNGGGSQGGGGSQSGSSQGGGSQTAADSAGTGESSTVATSGPGTGSAGKAPARPGATKHARTVLGHEKQVAGSVGGGSGSGVRAQSASPAATAARPAAEGSETLGVSGMDLLYILLAVGALLLTGVLTRRIASTSAPAGDTGS